MRKHTFKRVVLGATALSMLFAGSAFTAANTVPASNAGAGTATVSGYTAETIDYTLDGTDSSLVASVAIDITGEVTAGSEAELQLSTNGTWYSCTLGTYNSTDNIHPLSCDTTGEKVADATDLTLVIAD